MLTDLRPAPRPTDSALPFHRLAHRSPRTARWWRPLAAVGVAAGLYGVAAGALILFLAVIAVVVPGVGMPSEVSDPRNPMDVFLLLGLLALGVPAVVLGSRWGGGLRGAIHSVVGRIRWRMMLRAAAVVVPVYAVVIGVDALLHPSETFSMPEAGPRTVLVFAIILLLVPLQCAAEEYAFRALPQQVLGTWLQSPAWGIVLPVPLFMLGHGYEVVGQIDIAVFALCMGFLVWKSGGVELAIVVHTANNLILFLLAPFDEASLEQGAVDPALLLVSIPLTVGVTAALSLWVSRTHSLRFFEPVTRPLRP